MRRSGKLWFYRTLPMLAVGVLGVMLLVPGDGTPQTADVAAPATAPKPAIRLASAVAAPNATPASFKLAAHEVANTGAPALGTAPAVQAVTVSPPWPRLDAAPAGTALSPGKVGNVAVNMRAAPSSSADKLLVLLPGEAVQLGETDGGWTHVERADGQSGWVYSRLLAPRAA